MKKYEKPSIIIVEELAEGVYAASGSDCASVEAKISHFDFCTNGSHFCGEAGIPTIGYGPSLESLAHVRDEYIEIDQLIKAYNGYKGILKELTA